MGSKTTYELKFGCTFGSSKKQAYHTIRYDFKPASVDTSKPAELVVGDKNNITVTVPHTQEGESTVFNGSKRSCIKECVLVINKKTRVARLEKLSCCVQLKKVRSSKVSASVETGGPKTSHQKAADIHSPKRVVLEKASSSRRPALEPSLRAGESADTVDEDRGEESSSSSSSSSSSPLSDGSDDLHDLSDQLDKKLNGSSMSKLDIRHAPKGSFLIGTDHARSLDADLEMSDDSTMSESP